MRPQVPSSVEHGGAVGQTSLHCPRACATAGRGMAPLLHRTFLHLCPNAASLELILTRGCVTLIPQSRTFPENLMRT